ncbi:MAG: hypothetical protein L6R19_22350 [Alphaproteobacteria bacterium]|nr:hypothetical protein [Alphaproteobacteria bacterium]
MTGAACRHERTATRALTRRQVLRHTAALAQALAATAAQASLPLPAAAAEAPTFVLHRGWILTARDIEVLGLG